MSFQSILKTLNRPKTFRRIRKGKTSIRDLPPYERGLYYEDFVCRWLTGRGYRILDRNYRGKKRSEIDIIAKDGETLVFIEVKARRRFSVYSPLRAIHKEKRRSIAFGVSDYLGELQRSGIDTEELSLRFDVVALAFDHDGIPCSADHYISYLVPEDECV